MSFHEIPVVRIEEVFPHPNADALEYVKIFGWTCCVRIGQFKPGDLVAYIPPDYVVDTTKPEFAFLAKDGERTARITVKRLRGIYSQGLLVPAPTGMVEGDNAIEALGVERYVPPEAELAGADNEPDPSGLFSVKYDVEIYQRFIDLFTPGEEVICTEKIHGANGRFVFASKENRMYCGSRTGWKLQDEKNQWWTTLRLNPWIEEWCRANPDKILYGEVFGQVRKFRYGASGKNDLKFAAFDILDKNRWLDYEEAQDSVNPPGWNDLPPRWAPLVYRGPFDAAKLMDLAEKLDSRWPGADHLAEGIVVRPVKERTDPAIGRVQLKIVSNRFLEKS